MMRLENYLNENIEIPKTVLKKENDAFAQIRESCAVKEKHNSKSVEANNEKRYSKSVEANREINNGPEDCSRKPISFRALRKRPVFAVAVIALAVLLCGTAVAAVVTNFWSRGLDTAIEATEDERISLEERGFVKNLDMEPITVNGVSVTPEVAVTDGTVGYISLKISGYDLDESVGYPFFDSKGEFYVPEDEELDMLSEMNTEGLHYITGGTNMTGFYRESPVSGYIDENGDLEYIAEIIYTDGSLFGRNVKFEMIDLGTRGNGAAAQDDDYWTNVVEGKWAFDVPFQNESEADIVKKAFEMSTEIEDTGCLLQKITVSSLSVIMDYSVTDEDSWLVPAQIILSDGEAIELDDPYYKARTAPGEPSETITALGRIIDVDKIDSIVVHYHHANTAEYVAATIKLDAAEAQDDSAEE